MFGEEVTGVAGHPHVGIAYLVGMLKQNSLCYEIIDMRLGYTYLQVLEFIKQYKPNLICITCLRYGYNKAYTLIEKTKNTRFSSNLPIVIGSPTLLQSVTKFLMHACVNYKRGLM